MIREYVRWCERTMRPEIVNIFALISYSIISFLLLELLVPLVFPAWFKDKSWKVWHRIAYYLLLLWLIATLNGSYINYMQDLDFGWGNYGQIMTQTLSLGLLPIVMLVLYRYNEKMVFYLKEAAVMEKTSRLRVTDQPEVESELSVSSADIFLAAEAYGNYVKVYLVSDGNMRQEVQRITLSGLVDDLSAKGVVRCHRSFAVAPDQVKHISGNAQGLQLLVGKDELEVPVSRTYLKVVREALG